MNPPPKATIDERAIATAVTERRLALCDLLDTLATDDWPVRSLCGQWTVQEVVAHLTLATRDTGWGLAKGIVRARGNWDRMNADQARAQAGRFGPPALVGQLRETAASTRRAPFSSPVDPLVDVLVHGLDITRPLELVHPVPPGCAAPALDHAVTSRWYGGAKRFRGLILVATDADWSTGTGDEVRGSVADLLLMATGRRAGLEGLKGTGVETLAGRLR